MFDLMFSPWRGAADYWVRAVESWAWTQWRLCDAQYAAGIDLLDAVAGPPAVRTTSVQDLERRALERVRRGLPPPREVYEVHNRGRIDWSRFPEWARPTDPEAFEGCGHEG
jgi:hypothetical protein